MSRTYIHKEEGRYKNVEDIEKISINLRKKWNRSNYDVDIQRAERKYKIGQQGKKEMIDDLILYKTNYLCKQLKQQQYY